MKSYFVETSVIIDYLKNKQHAVQLIDSLHGDVTSSYICLAELYEGIFRMTSNKELQEKAVNRFFNSLDEIYGINFEVAQKFGQLRAQLKSKGKIIEDFDLLIATICIVYNLTLITYNEKHFSRLDQLNIYQNN